MSVELALNLLDFYKKERTSILEVQKSYCPFLDLEKDKGWRGKVLEKMLYLENSNSLTDFENCELKSVPLIITEEGEIKIKETTSVLIINPEDLLRCDFEESDFFKKMRRVLFVLLDHNRNTIFDYKLVDFTEESKAWLLAEIKEDYLAIAAHILDNIEIGEGLTNNFSGKIGKWIQPRPKFYKAGGYGYAFFFKKNLLKLILGLGD